MYSGREAEQYSKESIVQDTKIGQYLSLSFIDNFLTFEDMLKTDQEAFMQVVNKVMLIGGKHEKDFIRRSLSATFSDDLASMCSWTGQKNNYKIGDTHTILSIKKAFRAIFPWNTEKDFEHFVMEWFRFANVRSDKYIILLAWLRASDYYSNKRVVNRLVVIENSLFISKRLFIRSLPTQDCSRLSSFAFFNNFASLPARVYLSARYSSDSNPASFKSPCSTSSCLTASAVLTTRPPRPSSSTSSTGSSLRQGFIFALSHTPWYGR
ncbi:uncharacterized protein LOC112468586 [Temnothorax curvispinosus]|uniref:Uncharacterized protein LOC112468586 n=1 Tax=Temnothorax curvispinosus TaxID=300111 RepID=A0A6J1RLJ4_9HYME|nr:uncharacterized protein LOC112468586 [Temnothorax curvispinosus]XP_024893604.1 uncharacterized protein LOC112468586 [Temnothorax curvispinosus]